MARHNTVILFDDNQERRSRLKIVVDFLGESVLESSLETDFEDLKKTEKILCLIYSCDTLNQKKMEQLNKLNREFDNFPFIVVASKQNKSLDIKNKNLARNIVKILPSTFTYTQMLHALHVCQVALDNRKRLIDHKHRPLNLFRSLVGTSKYIQEVRKLIDQVAETSANVLIFGESGTGKEVAARNIHARSSRAGQSFVPINCGAIPKDLLESELFGHEKGAFTGAIKSRKGKFEVADKGTIFLDEIGDMPIEMQVKLLRILEERNFQKVGGNNTIKVDVRVISATHRDLHKEIGKKRFREDLYFRLNVFPIRMPSLRERREDIPFLINELISRFEGEKKGSVRLLPDAIDALCQYDWPGNVRELANVIERLAIIYSDQLLSADALPEKFKISLEQPFCPLDQPHENMPKILKEKKGVDLKKHLVKTEQTLIIEALKHNNWVVSKTADYLNMRRTTLVEKIKKYGILKPTKEELTV